MSIRRIEASPKNLSSIPSLNAESTVTLESAIPDDFIEYCKLVNVISEGDIKKLELFDFQKELIELLLSGEYRTCYICKSRQLGISLVIGVLLSYLALKKPGFSANVFSIGQNESSKFGVRVKRAFNSLPGVRLLNDNIRQHSLPNESMIEFLPQTSTASRGDSVDVSVYDEAGFYSLKKLKSASAASRLWAGQNNSLSISISSPSDMASDFYEIMSQDNFGESYESIAERVVSGELPSFHHWVDERGALKVLIHYRAVPKFRDNPEFYEGLLYEESLSPEDIDREANLRFKTNLGNSFDYVKINQAFSLIDKQSYKELQHLGYSIIIGLDPCGFGQNRLGCVAIAVHPKELRIKIIAEWAITEPDYQEWEYWLKAELGNTRKAYIYYESNGVGALAQTYLEKSSDVRLYHHIKGYTANEDTKTESVAFLKWCIDNSIIEGLETISELKNELKYFSLDTLEASTGNDDLVTALLSALQHIDYPKWYRAKRGLQPIASGTSSLVGGKLKTFNPNADKRNSERAYRPGLRF